MFLRGFQVSSKLLRNFHDATIRMSQYTIREYVFLKSNDNSVTVQISGSESVLLKTRLDVISFCGEVYLHVVLSH